MFALFFFFFFQAEDGIRDTSVTGVQTCALPISTEASGPNAPPVSTLRPESEPRISPGAITPPDTLIPNIAPSVKFHPMCNPMRSEERRVGKECRSRWLA